MTLFSLWASLITLAALGFLAWPLLRGHAQAGDLRRERYALHASIVAELAEDLRTGKLDADSHAAVLAEAEARLIAEVGAAQASISQIAVRPILASLLLALPLAAGALYLKLGEPKALDPAQRAAAPDEDSQVAGMISSLEAKLALKPDNPEGWLMLARSYRTLGHFEAALKAFEKAWPAIKDNPRELAGMAGTLAAVQNSFAGKPIDMIVKALSLNASEPDALMLAGSAARERGDLASTLRWWNELKTQLEPGSEDALWLEEQINIVRAEKAGTATSKPDSASE